MLNLLTVSLSYANVVAHQWHIFHNYIIFPVLIVLVIAIIFFVKISMLGHNHNHPRISEICKWLYFLAIAVLLFFCAYNFLGLNNRIDATYITPYSLSSKNINGYSFKSLISTNAEVIHNKKIIPSEWRENKILYHKSHITNSQDLTQKQYQVKQDYNRQYHKQLNHIYAQKRFDKLNNKFLNKHYIHKLSWYNYL